MRILLAEDEKRLAEALIYILEKENYIVDYSADGLETEAMAETKIYDLILLDRMLPKKEGIEILKSLRANKVSTPVIFLTAKDTLTNKIEGLDAGADDYIVKPFSKDELLARIRAVSRRPDSLIAEHNLIAGKLIFSRLSGEVLIEEKRIKLTLQENQLLEYLLIHKGQILTKEQILDKIWGYNKSVNINNLELYIYYLRKKIPFEKCHTQLETIRGIGYCLKEK